MQKQNIPTCPECEVQMKEAEFSEDLLSSENIPMQIDHYIYECPICKKQYSPNLFNQED
jgi:uncharacterized protein with PIN domain